MNTEFLARWAIKSTFSFSTCNSYIIAILNHYLPCECDNFNQFTLNMYTESLLLFEAFYFCNSYTCIRYQFCSILFFLRYKNPYIIYLPLCVNACKSYDHGILYTRNDCPRKYRDSKTLPNKWQFTVHYISINTQLLIHVVVICKCYIYPNPQRHMMSPNCVQPFNELTVHAGNYM